MTPFVVFVLALCIAAGLARAQNRCEYSREDKFPCKFNNPNLVTAEPGQYCVHFTKIKNPHGEVFCKVKVPGQYVADIPDMGTDQMRVLYSPGFEFDEPYQKELRAEYKVQCGHNEMAFYNITHLNMRGKDCSVMSKMRCQDYVKIDRGKFGSVEECGNTPSDSSVRELENGKFNVVFRTSEEQNLNKEGFQMYVTCYRPEEKDMNGCTDLSAFNCTNGESARRRRCACHHHHSYFFSDIFPNNNYPPNLRIAPDLAKFHRRWIIQRGHPASEVQIVNILFNQTINFNQSVITIVDLYGRIVASYPNVNTMEIFNLDGTVQKHLARVYTERTPHFEGGGILIIHQTVAYIQPFQFDPRGIIPNEYEERELVQMTKPLLEYAKMIDANATFQESMASPGSRSRRTPPQMGPCNTFDEDATHAVMAALRNKNSCNPVLRAQSRATLTFYKSMEEGPSCIKNISLSDLSCSS